MKLVALIPARWASSRFPGKPLALINGRPMIEHVYRRALAIPDVDEVHIATDNLDIQKAALSFGGRVILTSPEHKSGSDRLAEAADILKLGDKDIILNIQGDQPAFDPDQPALLANSLREDPDLEMATLAIILTRDRDVHNPDHVKVAFGADHYAIYFSRAPIPWPREGEGEYYRHIGIYAYRAAFLRRFATLPEGRLERLERLEQLRALENRARIKVIVVSGLSPEVDVPADLAAVEEALRRESH
jgi:3-deoxy-manno-octulosonate cytidylyltransferase (CMP-KDO synthetase)